MIKAKTKLNSKYFIKSFLSVIYIFLFFIICGLAVTAICYPLNLIINYFRQIQIGKYNKSRLIFLQFEIQVISSNLSYHLAKLQNE